MTAGFTNATWSRIGESNLGFGIKRYQAGTEDTPLWRLQISYPDRSNIVDIDASVQHLREIQRFCERAIGILLTDGERVSKEQAEKAT